MSDETRNKNKRMAAWLKKMGVKRESSKCPMGCGRMVKNGGGPLIEHLARCKGSQRYDKRQDRRRIEGNA